MKWVLVVAAALAALGIPLFLFGRSRPRDHVASVRFRLDKPASAVWAVVSDFEKVPEWFGDVTSVRRLADVDGRPAWRERYGGFEVTNVVREWVPPSKIVREILPEGAFSGTWTIELAPDGADATALTVTEAGRVDNALFRAMMAFGDNRKTMRRYVAALAVRLETVAAER